MSNVGRILHNNGLLSVNDEFRTWRVEAEGYDWLVIRKTGDHAYSPELVEFIDVFDRQAIIDNWATKPTLEG